MDEIRQILWYIAHREEQLHKRQDKLKKQLDTEDVARIDFDAVEEFMENKGRLKELKNLSDRMKSWSEYRV